MPGESKIAEGNAGDGRTIPEEDYRTGGRYVFGMLGRLRIAGDRVTGGGATFVVKEMEVGRIRMLVIEVVAGA